MHLTEVTVGRIPGEIKQHFDNPSASEDFAVVLNFWDRDCHSVTIVSGADVPV